MNFCLPIAAQHRLERLPPVRVEGAAEVGDRHAGEAAQHPVDQPRGKRPAPGVTTSDPAPARDVRAAVDSRDELRDVLGRVLEIAVHRHDDVAARADEPGVHRRMLAEVAPKAHGPYAPVCGMEPLQLGEAAVRRPVVHEHDLPRPPSSSSAAAARR